MEVGQLDHINCSSKSFLPILTLGSSHNQDLNSIFPLKHKAPLSENLESILIDYTLISLVSLFLKWKAVSLATCNR